MIFFSLTHNVLQICDVADLVAVSFILPLIFIRSRMIHLPLNPPYSQMCCYGLVYNNKNIAAAPHIEPPPSVFPTFVAEEPYLSVE